MLVTGYGVNILLSSVSTSPDTPHDTFRTLRRVYFYTILILASKSRRKGSFYFQVNTSILVYKSFLYSPKLVSPEINIYRL